MSDTTDDLYRELLQTFRAVAQEHLQQINETLLHLESQSDESTHYPLLQEALRAAHSLKGAARAVSLSEIEGLAHKMESVLQQGRDAKLVLDPATCDVLYDTLDVIKQLVQGEAVDSTPLHTQLAALVEDVPANEIPADTSFTASTIGHVPPAEDTIRVAVNKLDDLMAQAGELIVSEISAEQRRTDVRALRNKLSRWPKMWREIKMLLPRLEGDAGQRLSDILIHQHEYMSALSREVNSLEEAVSRDTLNLNMGVTRLQDEVRRVRMVPFRTLVAGLQRALRDAARSAGKRVVLQVEGDTVELDKKVLETLKSPLLHLLRNAVFHGIETPEIRTTAGKSAEGQIRLVVRQQGGEVHIAVKDDGRGFDLEALRSSSENAGHPVPNDEADSNETILSLAFQAGLTTASEVTELAGRGMGLDIVRQGVEELQGRIRLENFPGQGATLHLVVPVSLSMSRGLLVQVGREHYALPLIAVEKIEEVHQTFSVEGQTMLKTDEAPVPLLPLAAILERSTSKNGSNQKRLAVILRVADQRLAVLVDDVLTEQELAVKPLGKPLHRVRNVEGTALLGTGEPVVVLNPADLVKSARTVRAPALVVKNAPQNGTGPKTHVLVVDDSITTRTLEKNILEAAGYRVSTAIDGLEALKRLESDSVDLVVADVQMPHLDGLGLTHQIREDAKHNTLPIILVTSLESSEDRERGLVAGANAYIVKRGFDQAELLATIERLL